MGTKAKDSKVLALSVLLFSTLYTECLTQQLNNNAQFINTNSFQNDNSAPFTNTANSGFIPNQAPMVQQTAALNTYAPASQALYDVNTISKGYSGGPTPGVLGSYSNQPVHGGYWSAAPTASQYQQYPSPQFNGYQQYPYPQPYYPQQYGYQHTGYNAYDDRYPSFNVNYWTRGPGMQQRYPNTPVYTQGHPVPYNGVPYQRQYPYHPSAYHHPGYYRKQNKGFLSGTGGGLVKGLLGAALVGVVARKVASG